MKVLESMDIPQKPGEVKCNVVLVDWGEKAAERYSRHWQNSETKELFWGHYTKDLNKARKDMIKTAKENQ